MIVNYMNKKDFQYDYLKQRIPELKGMTDLQYDYFKTGMTPEEIAKKYNISKSYARLKAMEYKPPKKVIGTSKYKIKIAERLLIFDEFDILTIEAFLKESNIWYEIPFNGCEIEIKSKL